MTDTLDDTTRNATAANAGDSKVSERVVEAARTARDEVLRRADEVTEATTDALGANPFGAVAGAIAIGAVAAALIPATEREVRALGPVAQRLREAGIKAFHAAREAGAVELSAAGLSVAAASDGVGGIVGKLVKAATAAGNAAATSVRPPKDATPSTPPMNTTTSVGPNDSGEG